MSQYGAIAITQFGSAEQLTAVPVTMPTLAENQVLIKVHYAAINPIDCKTRAGLGWAAEQNRDKLPWVPGYDMAGIVVSAANNQLLPAGTKVAGMVGFPLQGGCYAQYVVANIDEVVVLPDDANLQQAAGLPLAGLTAWQALFEHGQLQAGERVVISAAAGGVGHVAVQLARQAGAEVIALASKQNHAHLLALGADKVLDYHDVAELSQLSQVNMLLDLVGGEAAVALLPCLTQSGRVVTVPSITKERVCQAATALGLTATGMLVSPNNAQLANLLAQLAPCGANTATLSVDICACFTPLEVARAHQLSETGHVRGKLLLDFTSAFDLKERS